MLISRYKHSLFIKSLVKKMALVPYSTPGINDYRLQRKLEARAGRVDVIVFYTGLPVLLLLSEVS